MTNVVKTLALTAALTLATAGTPSLLATAVRGPQYQGQIHNQDQGHNRDQNRDQNREQNRDQNQDHSSLYGNNNYRLGNREGYQDYQRKSQRKTHNHKFRSDDERQAHDTGYQDGWQGRRYDNNADRPH